MNNNASSDESATTSQFQTPSESFHTSVPGGSERPAPPPQDAPPSSNIDATLTAQLIFFLITTLLSIRAELTSALRAVDQIAVRWAEIVVSAMAPPAESVPAEPSHEDSTEPPDHAHDASHRFRRSSSPQVDALTRRADHPSVPLAAGTRSTSQPPTMSSSITSESSIPFSSASRPSSLRPQGKPRTTATARVDDTNIDYQLITPRAGRALDLNSSPEEGNGNAHSLENHRFPRGRPQARREENEDEHVPALWRGSVPDNRAAGTHPDHATGGPAPGGIGTRAIPAATVAPGPPDQSMLQNRTPVNMPSTSQPPPTPYNPPIPLASSSVMPQASSRTQSNTLDRTPSLSRERSYRSSEVPPTILNSDVAPIQRTNEQSDFSNPLTLSRSTSRSGSTLSQLNVNLNQVDSMPPIVGIPTSTSAGGGGGGAQSTASGHTIRRRRSRLGDRQRSRTHLATSAAAQLNAMRHHPVPQSDLFYPLQEELPAVQYVLFSRTHGVVNLTAFKKEYKIARRKQMGGKLKSAVTFGLY